MQETELFQKLTNQDPKLRKDDPIYGIGSPNPGSFQHDEEIPDVNLEAPHFTSEDESSDAKARDEMAKNQQELDNMMLIQRGPGASGLEIGGVSNKQMMSRKGRPGYIRRCVVTSFDHARYHRAHLFYERAKKMWKKFEGKYKYAKTHFGHFKKKKRTKRKWRRGRREEEETPMLIQMNSRHRWRHRRHKRYEHREYRKLRAHARRKRVQLRRKFNRKKPAMIKYCEVETKLARQQGKCRGHRRFCKLYVKFGLIKSARRHCRQMKHYHRILVQAIKNSRRNKSRIARRARERARKARKKHRCSGRSWCETFHACKKGDRRVKQFHTWVKGKGYRFYRGACAHSNGRYGRRHKFWGGKHTFGQCKARCDRMGRSCQGITMKKNVKCSGRALSNHYKRYAKNIRRALHRARLARIHARRARYRGHHRRRLLIHARRLRERARKARVRDIGHKKRLRIARRAREQARKARKKAWYNTPVYKRRVAKMRRMRHIARITRERTRKARVKATRISMNKVRVARMKARRARYKLTKERSKKKEARCLHWIWWPKNKANRHWYKSHQYNAIVERARAAYRRRYGFSAKTPALSAKPTPKRRVYRQANYGNVPKRLLTNVFELKAYCIGVHGKMFGAKKAWCVVNNRCEGASFNRRFRFRWQYC